MYKIRFADEEERDLKLIGPQGGEYNIACISKMSGTVRPCGFKDDILYLKFANGKFIQFVSHKGSHRLPSFSGSYYVSCKFSCDIERVQGIEVDEESYIVVNKKWTRVEN